MSTRLIVATAVLLVALTAGLSLQPPTRPSATQRTLDEIRPAVVYVQTVYSASVTFRGVQYGPYHVGMHGTGLLVGTGSRVVTAADAVQIAARDVQQQLVAAFTKDALRATERRLNRPLSAGERGQVQAQITGHVTTGTVARRVVVQPGSSLTAIDAPAGSVIATTSIAMWPTTAPTLAVLKLAQADAASYPLRPASPVTTGAASCLGYPGSGSTTALAERPEPRRVKWRPVTNQPGSSLEGPLDIGFLGAPCIDDTGALLGLVTAPPGDRSARSLVSAAAIATLIGTSATAAMPNDLAYDSALRMYWSHQYRAAASRFAAVVLAWPANLDAQAYERVALQQAAAGRDVDGWPLRGLRMAAWIIIAGCGILLAVVCLLPLGIRIRAAPPASLVLGLPVATRSLGQPVTTATASSRHDAFHPPHISWPPVTRSKSTQTDADMIALPYLGIVAGPNPGTTFPIVRDRMRIGRGEECDLRLHSATLSRRHAELDARNGRYRVRDAGSANGTVINGEHVGTRWYTLRDGDLLQLGEIELVFHAGVITALDEQHPEHSG